MGELERADMQGIVMSAYAHLPCAAYVLLPVNDARGGRAWLRGVVPEIASGEGKDEVSLLNLAITFSGL